jgi:hypothetical protein
MTKKLKTRRQRAPQKLQNPDARFAAMVRTALPLMTRAQKVFTEELASLQRYMPREGGSMIANIDAMVRELAPLYCKGCPAACCRRITGEQCYFLTSENTCRIYGKRPLACRLYFCPDVPAAVLKAMQAKYHLEMFVAIDDVIPGEGRWNPKAEEESKIGVD